MKRMFRLTLIMSIILILSACTTTKPSEGQKSNESEPKILTISVGPDLMTWDIHNHMTTTTETIHVHVFDYLFMRDAKGEIQPHLAKSYKQIDPLTIEIELNEGIKFHNGDELTAEDVKFTFDRVISDETLRSYNDYKTIKEVKVISPTVVQFVTNEPDPMFLSRISRQASGILPKKYIEEVGMEEFLKKPVGSGPYTFKEWKKDDRVVLVKNENYFKEVANEWDEIVFKAIPEDSTRVAELLTKSVDIISNVSPNDWKRIEDNEYTKVINGISNRTYMLFLRTQKEWPTHDVRVRQAIDYAIDKQAIVDSVLNGGATVSLTRVNKGNLGVDESLIGQSHYDPEKAKQLLKEAGFEKGLEIELSGPTGRYLKDREVLQLVAGMLEEVGIKTNMNLLKWGPFVELREQQKHKDGYLIALGSSFFDAGQSLDYYGTERSESINGYSNEKIDQLLTEAAESMDENKRIENYKEIQKMVIDEVPLIPLFQVDQFYGVAESIVFEPRLDELLYAPEIEKK